MFEDDIQRIQQKLVKGGFGLAPPLSAADVSKFEVDHGIRLPDGYREFLLHVGNGGDGPAHGLLPLDQWAYAFWEDSADLPKEYLASPSHFAPDSPQVNAWVDRGLFHQGTITIAIEGCGYFTLLVVSGPTRGQVVGSDGGFSDPFFYSPSGFLQWYETWLDRRLELRTSSGPEALEPRAMRRWWQFWR